MEMKIDRLHQLFLNAELRTLILQGSKTGTIHEKDLKGLLSGVPMTEENWQELYRKLEEKQIRLLPETEGGSMFYPELEELRQAYSDDAPALMYLEELEKNGITRCLELEAEAELTARTQEAAADALVEGNLLRVMSVARQYRGLGMAALDLLSEGNQGLMDAVKSFHPEIGYPFVLYGVCCIRKAIRDGLDHCCRDDFRLPEKVAKAALRTEESRNPEEILQTRDNCSPDPQTDYRAMFEELLEQMTPREADIIRMRFGLTDGNVHTLEEVGQHFGVTRERIRQIENKFIRRGSHVRRRKKIRDFYS